MPADHSSRRPARAERKQRPERTKEPRKGPGASRLYALLAGALLCMLGVLGFFYDASFETGSRLSSDYLAGTLLINGWRNVVYLVSGLLALTFAARSPRPTAIGLGAFYLVLAIWGFAETERGIGDILGVLPLGNDDNILHLVLGALGIGAVLMDGGRPTVPAKLKGKRISMPKPSRPGKGSASRAEPEARRRPRADPRPGADA